MKMSTVCAALSLSFVLAACERQMATTQNGTNAPEPAAVKTVQLAVVRWGPDRANAGEGFNLQSDGNAGMWFEMSHPVTGVQFTASFDGKPLTGVVANGNVVTATLPVDYLAEPGTYEVALEVPSMGTKIVAGEFSVDAQNGP